MISVIMSTYNEKVEWIKESIESILKQTYTDFEFIITLDNPENQKIKEIIQNYCKNDNRIIFVINKENKGLVWSLNNMLKIAKGDYIARMDADDIAVNNRFEEQIKFMKKNKCDLCGSNIQNFLNDEDKKIWESPSKHKYLKKVLEFQTAIGHPTWMVKKCVYDNLNGYRNIETCEDYDFLIRAVIKGYKLGNVKKVLLKYRLNPSSISRSNLEKQALMTDIIKKYYINNKNYTEEDIFMYLSTDEYEKNKELVKQYIYLKNEKKTISNNSIKSFKILIKMMSCGKYFWIDAKNKIRYFIIMLCDKINERAD